MNSTKLFVVLVSTNELEGDNASVIAVTTSQELAVRELETFVRDNFSDSGYFFNEDDEFDQRLFDEAFNSDHTRFVIDNSDVLIEYYIEESDLISE